MIDKDESASSTAPGNSLFAHKEPLRDDVKALAERRLAQIVAVLGLHPDAFKVAYEDAVRACDGSHDRVLSQQVGSVTAALLAIEDPLLRRRMTGLLAALNGSRLN